MKLEKVRDLWTNLYTYFYTEEKRVVSPYFDSEAEALHWKERQDRPWKDNEEIND